MGINLQIGSGGFQCNSCDKKYSLKHDLFRHMRNIHGSDSGPLACQHCTVVCKNKHALQTHVYQYHKFQSTEKLRYFCKLCTKSYTLKKYLKKHCKIAHAENLLF